jgi:quercetin dioxygenase-like cupin family protein
VNARALPLDHDAAVLGRRLRQLRTERGLSLSKVAETTAISSSFLSLVETGRCDISVGRLVRLMALYEVSLIDLLGGETRRHTIVVRAGERHLLRSSEEDIEVFLLAHGEHHSMLPVLVRVGPGGGVADRLSHYSEVFVHVIEGMLELEVDGDSIALEPGDSAYFDARNPHRVTNRGPADVVYLAVNTPAALSSLPISDERVAALGDGPGLYRSADTS